MAGIRSPTNYQANGLNHSSRGQRPRKTPLSLLRPVRAIQNAMLPSRICLIQIVSPQRRVRPIGSIPKGLFNLSKSEPLIQREFHFEAVPKVFQGVPNRSKPFFETIFFYLRFYHTPSFQTFTLIHGYSRPFTPMHGTPLLLFFADRSPAGLSCGRRPPPQEDPPPCALCLCGEIRPKIRGIAPKSDRLAPKNL